MTITGNDKLTALKHLAGDRTPAFVAAAIGADETDVEQLLAEYGPDKERLRWAVDELERQARAAERAAIPRADHLGARPAGATAPRRPVHLTPEPASAAGAIEQLLARADKLTGPGTARVTRAAKRLRDDVTALEQALSGIEDRKRATARQAAAKAKARAEVERLQRELAEAKKRLKCGAPSRPKAKATTSATTSSTPSDAARIRAWARDNGVDCPAVGRVPAAVREQYENAHTGSAA